MKNSYYFDIMSIFVPYRLSMQINTNIWNKIRYGIYAPVYDAILANHFDKLRKQSIDILAPKPDEKILIVGGGTGYDLNFLTNCTDITATDITPAMVNLMKKRSEDLSMNVNVMEMDGQHLQFDDNSFDCVILHLILAVIPDPVKCLKEVERVLKPNGRIIVLDKFLIDEEKPGLARRFFNLITSVFATEINRNLTQIVVNTNLKISSLHSEEKKSFFKIALLNKL